MKKDYEVCVDEAVEALCFVKDNVIELDADYRDTADFLKEVLYEERKSEDLRQLVGDKIYDAYWDQIYDLQEEILKKAWVIGTEIEADAREYLKDTYCIEPPYDHFLNQKIKVNIMLATPEERNRDCVSINLQYKAMEDRDSVLDPEKILREPSGLSWLLEQQGHTMEELQATLTDYDAFFYDEHGCVREMFDEAGKALKSGQMFNRFCETHSRFLASVCQELENQGYSMGVMTVLAEMSIEDFIKMQSGEKRITMPANTDIGIFNPWNGSGSCLEIELEKPLVFSTDMIRDVQVEGFKPQFEYTVDSVYGLVASCWKGPISVEELEKPELDSVIQACSEVSKTDDKGTVERDLLER